MNDPTIDDTIATLGEKLADHVREQIAEYAKALDDGLGPLEDACRANATIGMRDDYYEGAAWAIASVREILRKSSGVVVSVVEDDNVVALRPPAGDRAS